MRVNVLPLFFSVVLLLTCGDVLAQTSGKVATGTTTVPEIKPPLFSRVFKNATNQNGYEEWVQAADLIQNNADVDTATLPEATLTFKRRVLADPSVVQALRLLRVGLTKPVASPRPDYDEDTLLPELSSFRKLARLLRTQLYVDFADGRVSSAIETLRVGLAFGYRIQIDTVLNGLVGVAMDAILLKEFASHFDQLSANQCDQVMRVVVDFLNLENPAAHLLTLEKGYELKALEARRSNADGVLTYLAKLPPQDDPAEKADRQMIKDYLTSQPQDVNTLIDDAKLRISALYDQALGDLSLPLAQRKSREKDKTNSPGASLFRLFAPDTTQILDKYSNDQAKLRLLGVHVLICRYRWEHNALPSTLAVLHADNLMEDPFTGDQIVYQRTGDRYTLYSQGPFKRDDTGQIVSQERVAVKLVP